VLGVLLCASLGQAVSEMADLGLAQLQHLLLGEDQVARGLVLFLELGVGQQCLVGSVGLLLQPLLQVPHLPTRTSSVGHRQT